MTNEEIFNKIKQYESKWGKLGHTNIMNPEKNTIYHSGTNKDISQGGNKTMSRMDNELYKFRQKVAAGKEANKLAHKSYISPDELNKMNYDQLMNSHTLIHAQNPLYGQQNPNAKYYKREGEPGKYRYYYTKEEYDAAHKQDNAQQYENEKKAANNNGPSKFNNMRADVVNRYAKIAREASSKDAAKAFYDKAKGGDEAIDELYSTIQEGFKSGKLSYKDGRFETDDDQLREDIEAFSDNIQKFAKQIGEASGKGREIQDELEKLMLPDIEAMSKNAEAAKHDSDKSQKKEEPKATVETVVADVKKDPNFTKTIDIVKAAIDNGDISYIYDKPVVNIDMKTGKPSEAGMKANEAWQNLYKSFNDLSSKNKENGLSYEDVKGALMDAFNSELKKKDKSTAKHSAISKSYLGDEIMDEYSVFQEKVKRGKEMNRIAHSTFISPSDLNARYEKDLEKEGILVHAGNYKYYNKIDLPNGTTRYFYTKAEWDAYQDAKGQTNYREDQKADARQAEINKQKEVAAQKQGMTGYNKYQENLKEDQKADARENAKKEASSRSGMNGYEEWKKEQNKKTNNSSNVSKDIQNYNDTLSQVKEADKSLNVQVAQNMREEAIKNSKVQSTPDVKPSELAVALKQILDDSKTLKAQEAQNKREEAIKKSREAGKEADRINKINDDYKNSINENTKLSSEIDKKYDFDDIEDEDDLKECWRDLLGDIREIKDDVDNPDKVRYDISENNESYSAYIDDYLKKEIKLNEEIETAFRKGQNARNYEESKRYGDEWLKLNKEKEYLVKEHKAKVYNYINNLYKELLK